MPGSRTVFGTTDTAWRVGLLRQPGADAVIPNPGYEADPMSTETPGKKLPRAASKPSRIRPMPADRSINVKSDAETVTSCTFERRSHTRTAQLQHVAHSRQPYAAGITRARVSAPSWAPLSPPRQIASRETGPRFPPIASRSVRSRLFLAHAPLQIRQAGAGDECELLGGKTTFQRCARPAQPGCVAQGRLARFRDLGMQYSR